MYWIDRAVIRKHEKGFGEFIDWSEKIIKDEITQNKNLDRKIAQDKSTSNYDPIDRLVLNINEQTGSLEINNFLVRGILSW